MTGHMTEKREGYKKTELGWLPEDWEVVKLGEKCDVRDGTHDTPKYIPDGIPFLTSKNLTAKGLDLYNINYISKEDHDFFSKRSHVENGDILFGMIGTVGTPVIVNTDREVSIKNVALLKLKGNKDYNNVYVLNILNSEIVQEQFRKVSNGGVQTFVSLGAIRNLYFPLPSLFEQQKIAAILSKVDEKIDAIDTEINATEKLKKALMRQLLTRGIRHTEFKETKIGKIPKDWEIVKLDAITEINSNSLSNNTDANYEIKYIDISSISCSGKISYLSTHKFCNAPSRARRIVKNGDIILSTVRPNLKAFALIQSNLKNLICSTGFAVLRTKSSAFNLYIYQCLLSDIFMNQITSFLVGSNYPSINSNDVKNLCIPLPSLAEQQKIADILSTVDAKLDILKEKKENYQTLKKGLMQQLLTGALRVSGVHLNTKTGS